METGARGKQREQWGAQEAAGTQREAAGTQQEATGNHGKQRKAYLHGLEKNLMN